jgi:hypothetical protein
MNMKSTRTFLMTAALIGAAFSMLNARAEDTAASFEQQLQITDGYYPQYTVHPRAAKPASAWAQLQNREFELQRAAASIDDKPVSLAQAVRSLELPVIATAATSTEVR